MKKLLSALLACVMLLSLVTITASAEDPVKIIWWTYTGADAPIDAAMVLEAANKYSAEKIGVVADIQYMTGDQLNIGMASGEYFDIAMAASWYNTFDKNAQDGRFADITDTLPLLTPDLYATLEDKYWDAAKINGRIYGIPVKKDMGVDVYFRMNEDYYKAKEIKDENGSVVKAAHEDLPEEMKFADLENYLRTYKAEYPDDYPMSLSKGGLSHAFDFFESIATDCIGINYYKGGTTLSKFYEDEEVMNRYRLLHKWYELGYIQPDAATTESLPYSVKSSVRSGAAWYGYLGWRTSAGFNVKLVRYDGTFMSRSTMQGTVMGINAGADAAHQEAALKYIQLLATDRTFRDILGYGIEGVHYNRLDDGTVMLTQQGKDNYALNLFITGSVANASVESASDEVRANPNQWERVYEMYKTAIVSTTRGFAFDQAPVEAEVAAVKAVMANYTAELRTGTCDPEEVMPKIIEELKTAGIDTIQTEAQSQLDAYIAKLDK